jgi:hypothetical protein
VGAERVNLALYGSGTRWEVLQFLSVTPQTPTDPFVAQYLVTGTVAGLLGSGQHSRNHQDGDYFVLVDTAVKSFPVPPADLNQELTFIGQTAGQALTDAEEVSSMTLTLFGATRRYDPPANLRLVRLDGTTGSPLLSTWDKPAGADLTPYERYLWRASSGGGEVRRVVVDGDYSEAVQWYKPPANPGLPSMNQSLVHFSEGGSATADANSSQFGSLRARQIIYGDCRIRFKLDGRLAPLSIGTAAAPIPCEVDTATNEFIAVDHYAQEGDLVNFLGGIPTTSPALNGDQYGTGSYYARNPTSDRFQISETPTGAIMDIMAAGAGQLYLQYVLPGAHFIQTVIDGGVPYLVPEQASSLRVRAVAGGECVIEIKSGRVNYYLLDLTTPRYVSGGQPWRHPYSLGATLGLLDGSEQAAVNVTIEHTNPRSFLYTREMQQNDFPGGIPSTVTVTVSRLSESGEGLEAQATG